MAWLYLNAGQPTEVAAGVPHVMAPIPPAPKTAAAQPPASQSSAPEKAPSETAQAPAPAPSQSPPPAAEAKQEGPPPPPPETTAPKPVAPAPKESPKETVTAKPSAPEEARSPKEEQAKEVKPVPTVTEKAATEKPPAEKAAPPKQEPEKEKRAAESKAPAPKASEAKPPETKAAETKEETKTAEKTAPEAERPEAKHEVAQLPMKPPEEAKPAPAKPLPGPDAALLERGREGMLPTIGPDGREPWKVYARPFNPNDRRPRIAVVIDELGLSSAATTAAIQQLPGNVTLAFSPYAHDLDHWTELARAAGHEVFLNLPMEPVDYPDQDPGPYALLTSIDPKQNLFRMDWLLSRAEAYAGVTNHMGSRFTTSTADLRPVLEYLKRRGLMFLDSRSSDRSVAAKLAKAIGMPIAYNNRFIDAEASRDAIDKNLADIERIARRTGYAVAMGSAYPVTIERLVAWIPKAEAKGFAIAPVTALADKQEIK